MKSKNLVVSTRSFSKIVFALLVYVFTSGPSKSLAEVKPDGTVVPFSCGFATNNTENYFTGKPVIDKICRASIVGFSDVEVITATAVNDSKVTVWKITDVRTIKSIQDNFKSEWMNFKDAKDPAVNYTEVALNLVYLGDLKENGTIALAATTHITGSARMLVDSSGQSVSLAGRLNSAEFMVRQLEAVFNTLLTQ